MHDGWQYVVAAYGLSAAGLGVWFWMIAHKLRANRPNAASGEEQAGD